MECRVRDLPIHYEEFGSGRPLLALHGWPLDHRHIQGHLEPIFEERTGWRRIYPDLPGMGETRGAEWITHQDQVLEIVLELMDLVAPRERYAVAGISYGGYLARGIVYRNSSQLDGMFINVPGFAGEAATSHLPEHRVLGEDPEFVAALKPDEQEMLTFIVAQSLELLEEFRTSYSPAGVIADHDFLRRLDEHFAFSFPVDSLPEPFPAPALILTGRYDNWCGYYSAFQLLENYPRASFAVLDRAGHALAIEQARLFRALVTEWLDRVEEYAAK